jgi:hypothetical protein
MRPTRFELASLLIAAVVVTYQAFVPPAIGLADSGDFSRILAYRGLAHVSDNYDDNYFSYFNSKYRLIPKFGGPEWYKTSTSLVIIPARWLSIRLGHRFFDTRMLAAFYAALFLLGLWMILVATRSLGFASRLILAGLLILVFGDPGYVAYFNSFYSEGTAVVFLGLGMGSALFLITGRSRGTLPLVGYFLASALFITSKPSYIPLALPLAVFGIYLTSRVELGRSKYLLAGVLGFALWGLAFWYNQQVPEISKIHGTYVGICMDLLPKSATPREDLVAIGLNPDYEEFSGTTPFQPDSPLNDHAVESDFASVTHSYGLPLFYLSRPSRLYDLSARCVKHAFSTRVRRLGYYEASTGKPPRSQPPGVWSSIRENLFPKSISFIVAFFATGIGAIFLIIKSTFEPAKPIYALYLLFLTIAIIEFFVAVLLGGGEPDVEKHLFMFNLAFDVCIVLLSLGAFACFESYGRARRSETRQASGGGANREVQLSTGSST